MLSTLTFSSEAEILAYAAERQEDLLRDNAYQETPIGAVVKEYLAVKKRQKLSPLTLKNIELVLYKLALYYAHKEIGEISGSQGYRLLMRWMDDRWPSDMMKATTCGGVITTLKTFFAWAKYVDLVEKDPTFNMKQPKQGEREADLYSDDEREALIAGQVRLRDRCALLVLFDLSLRCGELRAIQFKHMRLGENRITVFGKGSTVRQMPFRWERTRLELERYILELGVLSAEGVGGLSRLPLGKTRREALGPKATDISQGRERTPEEWLKNEAPVRAYSEPSAESTPLPHPDDYLLHPERSIRRGTYPDYYHDWDPSPKLRQRPLAPSTFYRWWKGCHERAGVRLRRPHEVRHTGIDDVGRQYGLRKAQLYARHSSPATTQRYMHDSALELEELFRAADRDG